MTPDPRSNHSAARRRIPMLVLAAGYGVVCPAIAEPEFVRTTIDSNADVVHAVFPADIDSDGDTDLIVGCGGHSRQLYVLESDGQSPPVFTPYTLETSIGAIRDVFAADIDGDEDIDILAACYDDHAIYYYDNVNGDATTFTRQTLSMGYFLGPVSVFADDLNMDGHSDVIAAFNITGEVRFFMNNGGASASFGSIGGVSSGSGMTSVFTGDINGDGRPDILTASAGDNTIQWQRNNGGAFPQFTPFTIYTGAIGANSVAAADLDGDGDIDVISTSETDGDVRWYENNGQANPGFTTRAALNGPTGARSAFPVDLDGDGDIDIVCSYASTHSVFWLENNGQSTPAFTAHEIYSSLQFLPSDVVAADLNADGDTDVITASLLIDSINWFENDQLQSRPVINQMALTGHDTISEAIALAQSADVLTARPDRFAAEPVINLDNGPGERILDLECIGDLTQPVNGQYTLGDDALASRRGGTPAGPPVMLRIGSAKIRIGGPIDDGPPGDMTLHGQTHMEDGAVLRADSSLTLSSTGSLSVVPGADFAIEAPAGASILGGFSLPASSRLDVVNSALTLAGDPMFTTRTLSNSASFAYAVAAADLDNDGDIDPITGSRGDTAIRWYESNGASPPSFTPRAVSLDVRGVEQILTADLDGDGDVDIISANEIDGSVRWYESNGLTPPAFTTRDIALGVNQVRGIAVGDIDGDGDPDVFSATLTNSIRWHENDGATTPSFTTHTVNTAVDSPRSLVVADINGDGYNDLVIASYNDHAVRWLENDGSTPPVLTPHDISLTENGAIAVSVADVDGDGDLDVLSAASAGDAIRWHENDGAPIPVFTTHTVALGVDGAASVIAADINRDAGIDLISVGGLDSRIRYHMNDGRSDPVFTSITVYDGSVAGTRPVIAADLDGDSDADLLSASVFENTFRWHETVLPSTIFSTSSLLYSPNNPVTNRRTLVTQDATLSVGGGFTNERHFGMTRGTLAGAMHNLRGARVVSNGGVLITAGVTNDGLIENLGGGFATFGPFVNDGVYVDRSSGATTNGLTAEGSLVSGPASALLLTADATIAYIGGDFDIAIRSSQRFNFSGAEVNLDGSAPQSFEVMSIDIGPKTAGLDRSVVGHYPIGTLRIRPGAVVDLVDLHDNAGDGQVAGEAVYVDHLVIDAGATLNTHNHRIYFRTIELNGDVDEPASLTPLPAGCPGDIANGDGMVDVDDLNAILSAFGTGVGIGDPRDTANDDGFIDVDDLNVILANFGAMCG